MSTCPENDIHSLYLDNELPLSYREEYEAHIKSCPKCAKKLESLKMIQNDLREESKEYTMTEQMLDESYERLMAKLSYSNTLKKLESKKKYSIKGISKYVLTGVAAAAIVAVVMPVKGKKNNISVSSNFEPIVRTSSFENISELNETALKNELSSMPLRQNNFNTVSFGKEVSISPFGQAPVNKNDSVIAQTASNRQYLSRYDVFGPFPNSLQGRPYPPYMKKSVPQENPKGFSLQVTSPLGNISVEIGK